MNTNSQRTFWSNRILLVLAWLVAGLSTGLASTAALALTVSPTSITVPAGSKASVAVSGVRSGTTVRVSSSNTAVATVAYAAATSTTGTATITGVAAGSATITIRNGEESRATVAATVVPPLAVSPSSVSVTAGQNATVSVSNATGPVTATSSNTGIATVSYASGTATIHGVAAGSATVTIRDSFNARAVAVTVRSASALTVSPTSVTVAVGQNATVTVSNANGTVRASSANTAIATVTYSSTTHLATIHGVAAGSTTVTIRDSVTSRTVSVTVTSTTAGLTVTPTSVTIAAGQNATVSVTNANGAVTASSANTAIATVTYSSGTATIHGVAAGSTTVTIRDSVTSRTVSVTVTSTTAGLTVTPTSVTVAAGSNATVSVTNATGAVTATSSNTAIATVTYASGTATIHGVAAGSATITIADTVTSRTVAVTVTATTAGGYTVLGWNNLGMHCVDGVDDSVFSILPPFNILNAQLVNKSTGQMVTSGVTLTFTATADTRGSINTISSTKTNFWQYAATLFPPLAPAPDVGLTGTPMASATPAPLTYESTFNWFTAAGIPITPYDDTKQVNYYPMVQVTAKDSSGNTLATSKVVLPVSDEINCLACHASTNSTNAAANAAKPTAGWVFDPNPVTDWKKNILRLHDQMQATNAAYTAALTTIGRTGGLYQSALNGKPTLCAACHVSNALTEVGYPNGIAGIPPLTQSLHSTHATAVDPASGQTLDALDNRTACYQCHPGSTTQCMRGAMSTLLDAQGNLAINCQSCHGKMSNVGAAGRVGWFQTPNCQACHHDGTRELSAVDANGNLLTWADTRFASNPNTPTAAQFPNMKPTSTPAGGFSMFRYSTGHGAMQCEACHGATHAEYPTTEPNDNVQSAALQGYGGVVRECTVCHTTVPLTGNGGPHGLHTVGQSWVGSHENMISAAGGTSACAYCHGSDFRGSPLSALKTAKTFNADGRTVSFPAGHQMNCYDCHNGPNGG